MASFHPQPAQLAAYTLKEHPLDAVVDRDFSGR
jgi:hypothetical protein